MGYLFSLLIRRLLFFLSLGIFFFLSLPTIVAGQDPWGLEATEPIQATIITPSGAMILAEIADTPAKRARGLMHRAALAPDHGMLFIFSQPGFWTFWMKNTHVSLDMVWLDQDGRVVHIEPRVPICTRQDEGCPRYRPAKASVYVLEIPAGMAEQYQIAPNTLLSITFPKEPALLPF
ncbi:MAG: DUF192 domain-containing protein [Nitrospirae bacterium]|nr:MAG: DUF192 domain-containing protein [Nitrospirota bacterium]